MSKVSQKLLVRFSRYEEIQFGDGAFLVSDVDGSIHLVDQFSAALWRFLETPRTFDACLNVLGDALPEVSRKEIKSRLQTALKKMLQGGYIIKLSDK